MIIKFEHVIHKGLNNFQFDRVNIHKAVIKFPERMIKVGEFVIKFRVYDRKIIASNDVIKRLSTNHGFRQRCRKHDHEYQCKLSFNALSARFWLKISRYSPQALIQLHSSVISLYFSMLPEWYTSWSLFRSFSRFDQAHFPIEPFASCLDHCSYTDNNARKHDHDYTLDHRFDTREYFPLFHTVRGSLV